MSDDLVKRLRDLGDHASFEPHMHHTAADRIEELEAHLEKLTKAARPFSQMIIRNDTPRADGIRIADIIEIRAALASLQGDKK